MKKYIKYISALCVSLIMGGALTSCVDDELTPEATAGEDFYAVDEDEYAMGVVMSLGQLTGANSRAISNMDASGLNEIEEYVNTENLYILFFNIDGTFLFQINKPVAIPIGQSANGLDNQWFIKIPVKDINENLIHYIEENPFKIAVLANWTYDAEVNTGGKWDAFEFHEPVKEDGSLDIDEFGKLQGDHISMLSHAQQDNVYEDLINNGYDHLVYRTETGPHMGPYTEWVHNYHSSINEADHDIRENFNVKENSYENPSSKYVDDRGNQTAINHFKIKYNNIWHLWYFGTDDSEFNFTCRTHEVDHMAANIKQDWLDLNKAAKPAVVEAFLDRMQNATYPSGNIVENIVWKMPNYSDMEFAYGVIPRFSTTSSENSGNSVDFDALVIGNTNISWEANSDGQPLNLNPLYSYEAAYKRYHPYIRFTAHADGYLRVHYESQGGAKLYAHVGRNNTPENDASGYQKDNRDSRYLIDEETGYMVKTEGGSAQIADIPFDPKDVYIYMVVDPNDPEYAGNITSSTPSEGETEGEDTPDNIPVQKMPQITIYGFEYIESRHLYDADRSAILPSKDYPIPMYGIQDFDPIGEYWEPGVLFNLSQFNNAQKEGYSYRSVSLLRSLSRVEVKLLKSAFPQKPSHVFMRSMNRSARIMPVDFFTPTDIIWNGFNQSSTSDVKRLQNYVAAGNLSEQHILENSKGVVQEEKNIMQYGPIYIGNNTPQSGDKMINYRRTTAWPFGIWEQQWGWNWNRENPAVGNFETYKPGDSRDFTGQTVPEYPRILHTRISRSDYCRMTEVDEGSDGQYWHYIMYIPEKNITDADEPGDINDRPKIIHVELRFNGGPNAGKEGDNPEENYVDNFDDKLAYRLYFTEGGMAHSGSFQFDGRGSWDAYEYDLDIVKQHWPILRNHVYTFTVNGIPTEQGSVDFQADAPDQSYGMWWFY